jgi:nitric oxide reductase subunit B
MLIAGYEQSFLERAIGGSTWQAYFEGQTHPWFVQAMVWRQVFGLITFAGLLLLIWDLLSIGAKETRSADAPTEAHKDTGGETLGAAVQAST